MKFDDSFTVPVGRKKVWDALTDIERIYPALPGAELIEVKDNEFHGLVTMKLGPITAKYQGTAKFDSMDEDAGKLVINAQGRDKRGQGTARGLIEATVIEEAPEQTRVEMVNDIEITGKAAQFGRGILQDVSKEIMADFAGNLEEMLTGPDAGSAGADAAAAGTAQAASAGDEASAAPAPAPPAGSSLSVAGLTWRITKRRAADQPVVTGIGVGLIIVIIVVLIILIF
ncbi:MAG: SRPBCC family protein [Solirubrobacterales bacterium]